MTIPSFHHRFHVRALAQAIGLCLLGVFLGCAQNDPGTKGNATGTSGGSTSIKLDKPSITLLGVSNSGLLASTSLTVTYSGTTPIDSFPPGTTPVTWINLTPVTLASGVSTYTVAAANDTLAPGTYTTTLRFSTALADGSSPVYVDLPITYTLTATIVAGETGKGTSAGAAVEAQPKDLP